MDFMCRKSQISSPYLVTLSQYHLAIFLRVPGTEPTGNGLSVPCIVGSTSIRTNPSDLSSLHTGNFLYLLVVHHMILCTRSFGSLQHACFSQGSNITQYFLSLTFVKIHITDNRLKNL